MSGLLVSQDPGGTWEPLWQEEEEVDAYLLATSPAELEVFYQADLHIGQEKQPDLLYRSQDGGRDWQCSTRTRMTSWHWRSSRRTPSSQEPT